MFRHSYAIFCAPKILVYNYNTVDNIVKSNNILLHLYTCYMRLYCYVNDIKTKIINSKIINEAKKINSIFIFIKLKMNDYFTLNTV